MKIDIQAIEPYLQDAIKDIKEIIKFKSVLSEPELEAPFGIETKKALDYAMNLCKKIGLDIHYGPNNEYGYADYGKGQKLFAIVGHLDVVPAGDLSKWTSSPWDPIIKNDELYGRGTLDDKGPTIINIYAVKFLKDHGFVPQDYTIRIIFGLTEETLWASIASYLKHEIEPDLGYTPDGEWPLTYAEKTIAHIDIVGPGITELSVFGGHAYNVVSGETEVISKYNDKLKEYLQSNGYEYTSDSDKLIVKGLAAHGSTPTAGISAIMRAVETLYNTRLTNVELIDWIWENFNSLKFDLAKVFENWEDETGRVTVNIGKIRINEKEQRVCLDARIPISYTRKQIEDSIQKSIKNLNNLHYEITGFEEHKYVDPNSDYVQKLLKIYKEVSNDYNAQPLAIGGGTYGRKMKNIVAYGAIKDSNLMHSVDERIPIKDLREMLLIYISTLLRIVT